jgi:hypothetical protein
MPNRKATVRLNDMRNIDI